jgi:hypothetical protein
MVCVLTTIKVNLKNGNEILMKAKSEANLQSQMKVNLQVW